MMKKSIQIDLKSVLPEQQHHPTPTLPHENWDFAIRYIISIYFLISVKKFMTQIMFDYNDMNKKVANFHKGVQFGYHEQSSHTLLWDSVKHVFLWLASKLLEIFHSKLGMRLRAAMSSRNTTP